MKKNNSKVAKSRIRGSYLTSLVSSSLVLFVIGLIGALALFAQQFSTILKENVGLTVYLNEGLADSEIFRLKKLFDAHPYVKSTEYINKEEAQKILAKDLGEEFIEFVGENPLPASIEIKFFAPYVHPDTIQNIQKQFGNYAQVHDFEYQEPLLYKINKNVKRISFVLLGLGVLLFIISFTLISNTIRLSIYSKRFIIYTMQLVGASWGFIRKPFLRAGFWIGFFGGIIANILLIGILYAAKEQLAINDFLQYFDFKLMAGLLVLIVLIGILISWISSLFAINKYLRLKFDELYY